MEGGGDGDKERMGREHMGGADREEANRGNRWGRESRAGWVDGEGEG